MWNASNLIQNFFQLLQDMYLYKYIVWTMCAYITLRVEIYYCVIIFYASKMVFK